MQKVKRLAKAGEIIEITANKTYDDRFQVGDMFIVKASEKLGVRIDTPTEDNVFLYNCEYFVLEPGKFPLTRRQFIELFLLASAMLILLTVLSYFHP